jgi:PAS domain S-box-containing protein
LADLVHPDEVEGAREAFDEAITAGRSRIERTCLRHRDGRWIAVEAKGTAVLDEHGAPKQVLIVVREL